MTKTCRYSESQVIPSTARQTIMYSSKLLDLTKLQQLFLLGCLEILDPRATRSIKVYVRQLHEGLLPLGTGENGLQLGNFVQKLTYYIGTPLDTTPHHPSILCTTGTSIGNLWYLLGLTGIDKGCIHNTTCVNFLTK